MLQVAEEEELQVEVGSFCSAFLQEFIIRMHRRLPTTTSEEDGDSPSWRGE